MALDDLLAGYSGLARSRNKQGLAEGVETPTQRDFVQSLGVDLMQGFLFGRPAPRLSTSADVRVD